MLGFGRFGLQAPGWEFVGPAHLLGSGIRLGPKVLDPETPNRS